MNAWFPRINMLGEIASGNAGIWTTFNGASAQVSPIGTMPIWAGATLVFNRNDGTSDVGGQVVPGAYNLYVGGDDGRWVGGAENGDGWIDVFHGGALVKQIGRACKPSLGGSRLAYITPYQSNFRTLIVDDIAVTTGALLGVQLSRGGEFFAYQIATGTYTKAIFTSDGHGATARDDEALLLAFIGPAGEWWIVTQTPGVGTLVRPCHSVMGYQITGDLYFPDARMFADTLHVVGSNERGEPRFDVVIDFTNPRVDVRTLKAPDEPPVEPDEPIGPRSDQRPADSRTYDLLTYILGAAGTWPRKGPTHPMHQHLAGDLFHFVKFNDPGAYETWASDANWIYHLEDASSNPPYSFLDPRWFPRVMQIGEARGFDTGHHETQFRDRSSCTPVRREPYRRKMWLHAVYDRYYWGPDLGERETIVVAYDPTGGFHGPGRSVELGFYAKGAGSCRWESYGSERVYENGPAHFPPDAMWARSDFYLLGGQTLAPKLTGCVPQVCPHLPPWQPLPPQPKPSQFFHHKGISMATEIDGKTVVLRGPKGMLMRPDAPGTGIWKNEPGGWRGGLFDVADSNDIRAHHVAKKLPNGRYLYTNVQNNCRAGEDAGQYTPDILQQFYYQPTGFPEDKAGDLEQWRTYDGNQNGALEAQCEQTTDDKHPSGAGKKFFAYPLAVEVV